MLAVKAESCLQFKKQYFLLMLIEDGQMVNCSNYC